MDVRSGLCNLIRHRAQSFLYVTYSSSGLYRSSSPIQPLVMIMPLDKKKKSWLEKRKGVRKEKATPNTVPYIQLYTQSSTSVTSDLRMFLSTQHILDGMHAKSKRRKKTGKTIK